LNANNPDYAQEDPVIKTFVPYGISLETIERVKSLHYVQQRNAQLSLVSSLDERIKNNTRVEDLLQEFTEAVLKNNALEVGRDNIRFHAKK
jgi:flagellar hook-associated protein 1 FlgK